MKRPAALQPPDCDMAIGCCDRRENEQRRLYLPVLPALTGGLYAFFRFFLPRRSRRRARMRHHRLVALFGKQRCQHLRVGVAFHMDVEIALRERNIDPLLAEAFEDRDPQRVFHAKPGRQIGKVETQFEIQRKITETEEFHMRFRVAQHRRLRAHQLQQDIHDLLRIGIDKTRIPEFPRA